MTRFCVGSPELEEYDRLYPVTRPYRPSHCAGCREIGVPRLLEGKPSHSWPNKWPGPYEGFSKKDSDYHWVPCTADEPHEECVEIIKRDFARWMELLPSK